MKPLGLTKYDLETEGWFHAQVQKALVELFETKELYQSVAVDLAPIEKVVALMMKAKPITGESRFSEMTRQNNNRALREKYSKALKFFSETNWQFDTETYPQRNPSHNGGAGPVFFRTPTIKVSCNFCNSVLPAHNSGYPDERDKVYSTQLGRSKTGALMQVFAFPFVCQSCKKHPIVYMVTRRGLKLVLTGRSEFPKLAVLSSIPAKEMDYFEKAVISESAGFTLAGLFYLRVFIEQYLRRVTAAKGRKTCEELGELYRPLLHDDFPRTSFKSLDRIYDEISEKIHEADPSSELFMRSKNEIERHFKQLELLPLKSSP